MLGLARTVVAFSSLVGGVVAVLSGDWGVVLAALLVASLGMVPVSLLLLPGGLLMAFIVSRMNPNTANATSGPGIWVAATIGTAHSSIVQVVWVLGCALVLGGATDGATPAWAMGLLLIGAAYGTWEWLASKDMRGGNASSTIQLAHYALGLFLFYLTFLLADGAAWLAIVLLMGAQLSAIPRIVEFEQAAAAQWRVQDPTAAFFSEFYAAEDEVADPSEWPSTCPECGESTGEPPERNDLRARFCRMCAARLN